MGKAALEGIKVLDFTNNYAGPTGAAILADFGATVIHIERPVFGDDCHRFGPIINGEGWQYQWPNRGKKSVEIDLNDERGRELIKKMIPDFDIIIESFRPGIMKKFGLDYDSVCTIKPDIIYCSLSAFGHTGPKAGKAGYDLIAQAMSGIMSLTGEADQEPQKSGIVLGDVAGGMNAFTSIMVALFHRLRTGEGQNIDLSLYEGLVSMNAGVDAINHTLNPRRSGNHHVVLAPYGVFNGNNGESMVICAPNEKLWEKLCTLMDRKDMINDPNYNSSSVRVKNLPGVIAAIETYIKGFDKIDEVVEILDKAGIPCSKIAGCLEVLHEEHLVARGGVAEFPPNQKLIDAGMDKIRVRGPWLGLSKTPQIMKQPPVLGQHNHEVLDKYMDADKVEALETEWSEKMKQKK